jgi:pyridoxine 5'-phosphate synthase PdxJ
VSIGHALISHAIFVGLDRAVRDYLHALAPDVMTGTAGLRT